MATSAVCCTNFQTSAVYLEQESEDQVLVKRVLAGNVEAFEPLVLRYQRPVFTLALRILGDRRDAEDATQNAFVKAYQKLETYNRAYRFFTWLYRIALNECLNLKRARHEFVSSAVDLAEAAALSDPVELEERRRHVQDAILALPIDYRKVVVLRHFSDLTYEELSLVLGIPNKTVKSRLHTARQRLAHSLKALAPR